MDRESVWLGPISKAYDHPERSSRGRDGRQELNRGRQKLFRCGIWTFGVILRWGLGEVDLFDALRNRSVSAENSPLTPLMLRLVLSEDYDFFEVQNLILVEVSRLIFIPTKPLGWDHDRWGLPVHPFVVYSYGQSFNTTWVGWYDLPEVRVNWYDLLCCGIEPYAPAVPC